MFGRLKNVSYGIHIHDSGLKLAALQSTKREVLLTAVEQVTLDAGVIRSGKLVDVNAFANAVRQLQERHPLSKNEVVISIPTINVILRKSRIASLTTAEMRNLIDLEMHAGDKLPFKNPIFDFVRISQLSEQQAETAEQPSESTSTESDTVRQEDVLVFASPEDSVEGYLSVFKEIGVSVKAIDVTPLATFRLLVEDRITKPEDGLPDLFVLADCSPDTADVAIFENGLPVFIRSVNIPVLSAFDSEADRREHYLKTMSTELSRILNYFKFSISSEFRDVGTLIFCGKNWLHHALKDALKTELKMDVKGVSFVGISVSELLRNEAAQLSVYSTAIGLALKGLKG